MEKYFCLPAPNNTEKTLFEVVLAGITYSNPDYSVYRKCSDIFVVEHVTQGEGTVICGGKEYFIKKGDTYILPSQKEHHYYSSRQKPWTKKWINISGSLCQNLLMAYEIENTVHFPDVSVDDILDEFFDFCTHNTNVVKINEKGAVIFHRIVQRLSTHTEIGAKGVACEIKSYIDSNIYTRLTATSVAQSTGFSVSQLGRIFKAEYSTTVYSYILERKIDTAENLLKNTNFSIKEISNMLSFTDEHYFCNIFKRKRSITPREYRKQCVRQSGIRNT